MLFALGGNIQNVLHTDAPVTASGKPPEGEHAILAEPIHVLTGYPHEVSGLGRRKLFLGAHHHDPRPVSDGIEHRAHRSLDRAIAVQALRETLRVGADGGVDRIEGGGKKCVRCHDASLAPTAIMTTVNLGIGQPTLVASHPPAVGGAMNLAIDANETWVMMDLLTRQGYSGIVAQCTYPLTAIGCVKRIYSDLATLECTPSGLKLIDTVPDLGHAELGHLVGLSIRA